MKKNADCGKPFTLNKQVRERVNQWETSVKMTIERGKMSEKDYNFFIQNYSIKGGKKE
jgi:hypothetical protein